MATDFDPAADADGSASPNGSDAADAVDAAIDLPVHHRQTVAHWVNFFNNHYQVVNEHGHAYVYERRYDSILDRNYYVRMKFDAFKAFFMNRKVEVGLNKKDEPQFSKVADVWLGHPDRKQYLGGILFDPSGRHCPRDAYNLWSGFPFPPKAGSWALIRKHLFEVICGGSQNLYDYVLRWLARMVQVPNEQGHVVLVLQGEEGTGKGVFITALRRMLGQHALAVSNATHFVGKFNAHLADLLLLFADEAVAPADRKEIAILKALITEPTIIVEFKGGAVAPMPNYLHVIMASNEEHVISAALGSRRYVVLKQPSSRIGDVAYFKALYAEVNDDAAIAAMLYDLLNLDLTDFVVQDYPRTEGLDEQRKLSLRVPMKWWAEVLAREYVFESQMGVAWFSQWHEHLATDLIYSSYLAFEQRHRGQPPLARETFCKFLVELGAVYKRFSKPAYVGEKRVGSDASEKLSTAPRPHGYWLGLLSDARVHFENITNAKWDWPPQDNEPDPNPPPPSVSEGPTPEDPPADAAAALGRLGTPK